MAENAQDLEQAESESGIEEGAESPKAASNKRKRVIIASTALLLVLGGIGALYALGVFNPLIGLIPGVGAPSGTEQHASDSAPVFYELPEFVVSLNTGERRSTFLKTRISLELESSADISRIERLLPRVIDSCQVYLRELRIDDLKGSAGMLRLREELLRRISLMVAPTRVNDVLFLETLIQ